MTLWQALSALALAVMCCVLWGAKSGWSVLTGGGIGIVSTGYMAFALLRQRADASAAQVALSFFVGWVIKILLTIGLLWLAFRSQVMAPLSLIAGFGVTLFAFWLAAVRRHD
jgi:F0F1-type ATP synthase assembly protein I